MPRPAWFCFLLFVAVFLLLAAAPFPADAAMFCPIGPQTFFDEMDGMDVVVIVILRERSAALVPVELGPEMPEEEAEEPMAKFEIDRIIKGSDLVKVGERVEAIYSGDGKPGARFLLMGVNEPPLGWATPTPINVRSEAYIHQLARLPEDAKGQMRFFYSYL